MQIQASSQVIPLPGVPTLFLDVKTPEEITNSKAPRPPQDFRGFQLFQVVMKSGDPPSTQVAIPHLQGKTECSWISKQEQVLPLELEEAPQITVPLSIADPHHWNIVNDPIFPNCLATFRVRHEASLASGTAALTGRAPTVIGEHWIDHLDAGGHIAKCKPHDFKFEDEWLPLYTRAGVTRHMSGLSWLLKTQGDSPLIAVVPPDMLFRSDREYVIHKLHEEDCLSRVTIYYGENLRKLIAFCPYCGVTNKNTATAYSHARKHLGITFLCGGCYIKLYKAPQHLSQHMKTCPPCLMNRPEGSQQSVRKK